MVFAEDNRQHFLQLSAAKTVEVSDNLSDVAVTQTMDVDAPDPITTTQKWPRSPSPSLQESSKRLKAADNKDLISITAPSTPLQQTTTSKCPSANLIQALTKHNTSGPVSISHSAVASQKLRVEMRAGTHKINKVQQNTFKSECNLVDPHAEFRYGESWQVFHSRCGKWLVMTELYNTTRF